MLSDKSRNTKTKKKTFFEKYDLYSDANPADTVRIRYTTVDDVKNTIKKVERLYKKNVITHTRAVQIVNVLVQRLRVIEKNFNKGSDRLRLARRYFNHLKKRTKLELQERKKFLFKI